MARKKAEEAAGNDKTMRRENEFATKTIDGWTNDHRPGYFGAKKKEKIAELTLRFQGPDNWRLAWLVDVDGIQAFDFVAACKAFYEESYFAWLSKHPDKVDLACTFGECIDNAPTNVFSGTDYEKQEARSTHIQDIAMRNALARLDRRFEGPADKILVIRSSESNGFVFGPGNVPFLYPQYIIRPSLAPAWAEAKSVEDFWQSNKWVQVRAEPPL